MIRPTVGRVVWFYKYNAAENRHQGPLAAHICHVHSDECVNLMVISENGFNFSECSVYLKQTEVGWDKPPSHNYCEWMPYQVGQAAKTEQLERVTEAARKGFNP